MKAGLSDPLNIGGGKKIILVTCRAKPSDSSASFVLKGMVDAHMEKLNPFSRYLRQNYMIMVVPTLSTDGTLFGNSYCDTNGMQLDVLLSKLDLQSSGAKSKSLELTALIKLITRHLQQQDEFVFYCHLESNFGDSHCGLRTCVQSDTSSEVATKMKFPILVSEGCNHTKFSSFKFEHLDQQRDTTTGATSFHDTMSKLARISNSFTFSVPAVGPVNSPLEEEQYLGLGRCFYESVGVYLIHSALTDGKGAVAVDREVAEIVAKRCENLGKVKRVHEEYLATAQALVSVPCAPLGTYWAESMFTRWGAARDAAGQPAEPKPEVPQKLFEGLLGQHLKKGLLLMVGNTRAPDLACRAKLMLEKDLDQPNSVDCTADRLRSIVYNTADQGITQQDQSDQRPEQEHKSFKHTDSKIRSGSVEDKSSSKRLEDMIAKMVGAKQKLQRETPVSEFIATAGDEMEGKTFRESKFVTDFTSQNTSRSGPGSKRALFRISNDPGALKKAIDHQTKAANAPDQASGYMSISAPTHQPPGKPPTAEMVLKRLSRISGPVNPGSRIINSTEQSVVSIAAEKSPATSGAPHRGSLKDLAQVWSAQSAAGAVAPRRHLSIRADSGRVSPIPVSRGGSQRPGWAKDVPSRQHSRGPSTGTSAALAEDSIVSRPGAATPIPDNLSAATEANVGRRSLVSRGKPDGILVKQTRIVSRGSLLFRPAHIRTPSLQFEAVECVDALQDAGNGRLLAVDSTKKQAKLEFAASCTTVGFGYTAAPADNKTEARSDRRGSSNSKDRKSWMPPPSIAIDMRSLWAERDRLVKGAAIPKPIAEASQNDKENVVKLNGYNIVFQRPPKGSKKFIRPADDQFTGWATKGDYKLPVNKTFNSEVDLPPSIKINKKVNGAGILREVQAQAGRRSLFVTREGNTTSNF